MDLTTLDHQQAIKRLSQLRIISFLSALCLTISIACIIAGVILTETTYRSYIDLSPSTDQSLRKDAYKQAIALCPDRLDAYLKLLDLYTEDGVFKKEESEEFLSLYNSNHNRMNRFSTEYSQLHYTLGYLYMSGYEEHITVCLNMALPFFETALETIKSNDPNYLMVDCYCQMGTFYRDYIWNVSAAHREVSPEVMQNLFDHIIETIEAFQKDTSLNSIYDQLSFYTATCNLLYSQRDIIAATVEYETATAVLDSIYDSLPEINSLQREKIREMVEELGNNQNVYRIALNRAYKRTEGYEWQ